MPSDINRQIARLVRGFREEQQHRQSDIAALVGLSVAQYSRLESGAAEWTVERLLSVCRVLGVSPRDVMDFGHARGSIDMDLTPEEAKMVLACRRMDASSAMACMADLFRKAGG